MSVSGGPGAQSASEPVAGSCSFGRALLLWLGLAPTGFPSTDQGPEGGVELPEGKEQLETGKRWLLDS